MNLPLILSPRTGNRIVRGADHRQVEIGAQRVGHGAFGDEAELGQDHVETFARLGFKAPRPFEIGLADVAAFDQQRAEGLAEIPPFLIVVRHAGYRSLVLPR